LETPTTAQAKCMSDSVWQIGDTLNPDEGIPALEGKAM
jgi:hypothetical protein